MDDNKKPEEKNGGEKEKRKKEKEKEKKRIKLLEDLTLDR